MSPLLPNTTNSLISSNIQTIFLFSYLFQSYISLKKLFLNPNLNRIHVLQIAFIYFVTSISYVTRDNELADDMIRDFSQIYVLFIELFFFFCGIFKVYI